MLNLIFSPVSGAKGDEAVTHDGNNLDDRCNPVWYLKITLFHLYIQIGEECIVQMHSSYIVNFALLKMPEAGHSSHSQSGIVHPFRLPGRIGYPFP